MIQQKPRGGTSPRGKSSGEPKLFIHLLLLCGQDAPAEGCSFVFGPTHANHATLQVVELHPLPFQASSQWFFRTHYRSPLSWQTVGWRTIPFLIEGRRGSNPHFLFTASSPSVTVLIYIYIIPYLTLFVKRFFIFFGGDDGSRTHLVSSTTVWLTPPPATLFRASPSPYFCIHYTINLWRCQEGFKLLSTSRRFGVIRGALLVLFGSPLDILIIPHSVESVKGFSVQPFIFF